MLLQMNLISGAIIYKQLQANRLSQPVNIVTTHKKNY